MNKAKKSKPRKTGHVKAQKKRARFFLGKSRWETPISDVEKHYNIECVVPKLRNKDLVGWDGKRALLKFTRSKTAAYTEGKYMIYEYEYKENLSQPITKKH